MPKFIIDEDMPRSTGTILKEHGYDIKNVRDYGFRGAEGDFKRNLIIIEPWKIRIRRK